MITLDHLSYTYPQAPKPVLHDISFDIPEGSFVLVAGASGAGKSTLLRCINGLVPHFSGGTLAGNILVNGLNPVLATPQQMSQHVGFVFQDPEAQFVVDQVEDEIAFALENSAMHPQEMRIRVEEVLDLLDLAPLRERRLDMISGGERQRVAIAAALAMRPQILVLDEPTSQLDPKSAEDVLNALVRLNSDLGLTILMAEHRMERVLSFVDTVLFLTGDEQAGGVLFGTPQQILPQIDLVPPLVALGKALAWEPLPLTIKEGMRYARQERARMALPTSNETTSQSTPRPAPAGSPYLHMQHVEVMYQRTPILRGITLDVHAGEIVTLMGRNGSGKTTLLKTLVGLVQPRKGTVMVAGQSLAGRDVADICRQVGYLPQDPNALLFAESVQEEWEITLRNHGMEGEHKRITELLDVLGLTDKAGCYPRDLSVGERQRVALGAIAIPYPGALLLDEPTRGLDYSAKQSLIGLLRRLRDDGLALVLVTHDVELAAAIASRVVLMSQGEIIANGHPADVMAASPLFAPQMSRLFAGTGWLTYEDVLRGL